MKKQLNKKGFTLIEVVLVLAIGGLIFLLAFLAFQQVSRNRRDTQRRGDAGRIAAIYSDLKADNPSAVPNVLSWGLTAAGTPGLDKPGGGDYTYNGEATKPNPLPVDTAWLNIPSTGTPQVCVGIEASVAGACRNVE